MGPISPFIGIKTSYGLEQAQSFLGSPSPPVSGLMLSANGQGILMRKSIGTMDD